MCCCFLGYPSEDRVLAETDGLFLISSRLSVITGRLNFYLLIYLFHALGSALFGLLSQKTYSFNYLCLFWRNK